MIGPVDAISFGVAIELLGSTGMKLLPLSPAVKPAEPAGAELIRSPEGTYSVSIEACVLLQPDKTESATINMNMEDIFRAFIEVILSVVFKTLLLFNIVIFAVKH